MPHYACLCYPYTYCTYIYIYINNYIYTQYYSSFSVFPESVLPLGDVLISDPAL